METIRIKLYDPADVYMSPSGEVMNAAKVHEHFPASANFDFIVHTDDGGEIMYGFYGLSAMKSKYNIDPGLSGAEAAQAVEDAMNAERQQQEEEAQARAEAVTPDERIAAALEFQTLTSLPDAE